MSKLHEILIPAWPDNLKVTKVVVLESAPVEFFHRFIVVVKITLKLHSISVLHHSAILRLLFHELAEISKSRASKLSVKGCSDLVDYETFFFSKALHSFAGR